MPSVVIITLQTQTFYLTQQYLKSPRVGSAFFFSKTGLVSDLYCSATWACWQAVVVCVKSLKGHVCVPPSQITFSAFLSFIKVILNVTDLKSIFPDTNKYILTFST